MGRFGANEVENYGSGGNSSFFSLRDDGEVAQVRFMYNSMEDVVGYAVHEVEIDGKRRYVNCLRSYNEPKSKCPFCNANNFQRAKLYIPMYDIEEDEVKVWERGRNFFAKMSALCARYSNANTPLVAHTFDVERHGKKGDTGTTYEIYETGCDDTRLEDLPEIPEVLGTIILDKTAEDMEYYLDYEEFPNNDGAPKRSESARTERATRSERPERSRYEEMDSRPVGRRTPSRRGDSTF